LALIEFAADQLGIAKRTVQIVSGQAGRRKVSHCLIKNVAGLDSSAPPMDPMHAQAPRSIA
jgi:uncharacterized protein YggU (UPF0235/DUF167 family)